MKLNIEITVKVTNHGEENETKVSVSLGSKFLEAATALEMAKESLDQTIESYFAKLVKQKGRPLTEKEADKILKSVTFKEIQEI